MRRARGGTASGDGSQAVPVEPGRHLRRAPTAVVAAVALALAAGTVWHSSDAAFSGQTATGTSSIAAGSVALSLSPTSAALSFSGAIPGSFGSSCVQVTYTGSLPADLRLYVAAGDLTGTLGPYVTLQVREGTGTSSTCSDFVSSATDYNTTGLTDTTKTLSAFASASSTYGTGVSRYAVSTGGTRTYRFDWQLQDDNTAISQTAGVTLTWSAQNT